MVLLYTIYVKDCIVFLKTEFDTTFLTVTKNKMWTLRSGAWWGPSDWSVLCQSCVTCCTMYPHAQHCTVLIIYIYTAIVDSNGIDRALWGSVKHYVYQRVLTGFIRSWETDQNLLGSGIWPEALNFTGNCKTDTAWELGKASFIPGCIRFISG